MSPLEERIAELERLAEVIRGNKRSDKVNSYENIDAYHKWRTECMVLFTDTLGAGHELVKKFDTYAQEGNGYVLMHNFDPQFPIFQVLMRKIKDGEKAVPRKSNSNDVTKEDIQVFISHASPDVPIVRAFRDDLLITALGVRPEKIFCSTLDGTKVESGEDWRASIRAAIRSAKISFLIITPHFKESEVCQNEMGGAWIGDGKVLPLIVEPITYDTVGVIQKPNQIEKLADGKALDRIKDKVVGELGLGAVRSDLWSSKKEEFLVKLSDHLGKNPPPRPLARDEFDKLKDELAGLKTALTERINEVEHQGKVIADLKLTKDAEEVQQVMKAHNVPDPLEEFKTLVAGLKKLFDKIDNVVCAITLCDHFNKPFEPIWDDHKQEIDAAVRDEILNDEAKPNDDDQTVRSIYTKLSVLIALLDKDDSAFEAAYEAEYGTVPMEVRKPQFWLKHFGVSVPRS